MKQQSGDNFVKCKCGGVMFDERVIIRTIMVKLKDEQGKQTGEQEERYMMYPAYTCAMCGEVKNLYKKGVEQQKGKIIEK